MVSRQDYGFIIIVALIAVLNSWGFLVLNPAYPNIATELNTSPEQVSLIITAYALPGIFITPVYGMLSDRYGRRKILLPLICLYGIAGVAAGFSPNLTIILVFRVIQGFAVASFFPLTLIILGDHYSGTNRTTMITMTMTVILLFEAAMPLLGGILASYNWRWSFYSFSIAFLILLLLGLKLPETNPHYSPRSKSQLTLSGADQQSNDLPVSIIKKNHPETEKITWNTLSLSNSALFSTILMGICFFMITFGGLNFLMGFYVQRELQLSPIVTGFAQTGISVAVILGNIQVLHLTRKFKTSRILLGSFMLMAIGCGFLVLPPNLIWLVFGVICSGMSMGLTFSTLHAQIQNLATFHSRGLVTSLYQSGAKIGQTIGPFFFTSVYVLGGSVVALPFLAAVILVIVAGGLSLPIHVRLERLKKD